MDLLAINPGLIFWTAVTFIILFFLLKKYVWGPILDAVDRREQSLKGILSDAEKAREDGKKFLKQYEDQLANARDEVNRILDDGKSRASKSTEELIRRARNESAEIIERARAEIDRERRKAADQIKDHVVELSLRAAERLIQETLDNRKHRDLIQQAISEIDTEMK
ncbi:MAG: F0F1 ATP synthase subunit B [Gemmatimonadota bacterium]|nr:F0F1 ATP synthase subunit B [Gemmatimonadota bacterium]